MPENYDFFGQEAQQNTISIADIIAKIKEWCLYIWEKKMIVIIAGIVGAIIGLLSAIFQKIDYTATYKFTIENSSSMGDGNSLLSLVRLGGGNGAGAFSGDNLVELIKSRTMVENALISPVCIDGDTMTVIEYKLICNSVRKACEEYKPDPDAKSISVCEIEFPVGLKRKDYSRAQDSVLMAVAAGMLKSSISVEKVAKKLNFVNFSYTSKNENFSKIFANALLSEVQSFYIATRTEKTTANIKSFTQRADSIRDEMNKALYRVASIRDANLNGVAKVQVERLKYETDARINSEAYTELMKNIEVMKLDLARETPLIKVIDEPTFPLENNKKGKLMSMIKFGIIFGFLAVVVLITIYYLKSALKESTALAEVKEKN